MICVEVMHFQKWFLTLIWCLVCISSSMSVSTNFSLPIAEFNALYDLYNSTNGNAWLWKEPYSSTTGYPWNFTSDSNNPCSSITPWQGVLCTSDCSDSPCNVQELFLGKKQLIGPLPHSIGDFSELVGLSMYENMLTGTIPETIAMLQQLEILILSTNRLYGTIPSSIGTLTNLRILTLGINFYFNGTIPISLTNCTLLEVLSLSGNLISGTLPIELTKLHNIRILQFGDNLLTGSIPLAYGNSDAFPKLELMSFEGNHLSGLLPSTLSQLPSLLYLMLMDNILTGTIPLSYGNFSVLETLNLYSNHLTGTIPDAVIANLRTIQTFDLLDNLLTGTIPPTSIWESCKTWHLISLAKNFLSGTIPVDLGDAFPSLKDLDLGTNLLTGTIPESLGNMHNFSQGLSFDVNFLTGSIPNSLGQLNKMSFLLLDYNMLTSSLPVSIGDINLNSLGLSQNFISGTIPSSYAQLNTIYYIELGNNLLSGSLPSQWTFYGVSAFDVSNNTLTGSIASQMFEYNNNSLSYVNFNTNAFTGKIPDTLLQATGLQVLNLAINCFTGTIPGAVCTSHNYIQIILDGLHSSAHCRERALPFVPHSGYMAANDVYGSIPSCIFSTMPELGVLHASSNSLSGSITIGNGTVLPVFLHEVILSSNDLTGTIPDGIWSSNITFLDLSLNRLQGTLPGGNTLLPFARYVMNHPNGEYYANFNVTVKLDVNQLSGTVPSLLWDLPSGHIDILEGNLFSCHTNKDDLPKHDPKYHEYNCASDVTNYTLITFIVVFVSVLCVCGIVGTLRESITNWWTHYYSTIHGKEKESTSERLVSRITGMTITTMRQERVERVLQLITSVVVRVLVYTITISLILYGILSVYYSSYTYSYVWTISAIYKSGRVASILMLISFAGMSFVIAWTLHKQGDVVNDNSLSLNTPAESKESAAISWKSVSLFFCVVITNITLVIIVNALYVSAVRSSYTSQQLAVIALSISIFKVLWNYLLLNSGSLLSRLSGTQRDSRKQDQDNDNNADTNGFMLSDTVIVTLCLFNNLLAPFIAEMFVSSDCLLYIVSQAPPLSFSFTEFTCQSISTGYECSYSNADTELSVTPAFHYSHQCSFALVSSYSYVFIMRYILSGLIEPLLIWMIRRQKRMTSGEKLTIFDTILPPLWKLRVDDESDRNALEAPTLEWIERYLFHLPKGRLRQRFVANMVTDISMLVCFGTLFPPLALVIALSIYKDTVDVRLGIGRFHKLIGMDCAMSVRDRLVKVREAVYVELISAETEIVSGIWYGMCLASIIWAFVLFDALSSSVGLSTLASVWIVAVMGMIPIILCVVSRSILAYYGSDVKVDESGITETVDNPISKHHVEMLRVSNVSGVIG